MGMKGRFFGYVRGSTNEQETTLQAQSERLQGEYQVRYQPEGYALGGLFTDRGVSGSTPLGQRPSGVKLMAELGKGDLLCLCKLDRGFRSLDDLVDTLRIFKQKEVRLVLLDLQVDTGTAVGRMLVSVLAAVAEIEREMIADRVRVWARTQREHGRPAGNAPWGWKSEGPRGKKVLVPDLEARKLGSCIVDWLEAGWTIRQVREHLFTHGYTGRDGWKMQPSTIWRIAANERALQAHEKSQLTNNFDQTTKS